MDRLIMIDRPGAAPRITTRSGQPIPDKGQVAVRMHAAALNFADLLMAEGSYQDTPPYPFVAGIEGAGIVEVAGPETQLAPGTRVAVWARGTLADRGIFPETACIPIPASMSATEAAGFQIAYGTSHLALTGPGALRPGQTLVVLGAGGGVGLTAVEIGNILGARVIGVARGKEKIAAVRRAGAAEVIDSAQTPDLKAALKALGGVDLVYDAVGDAPGLAAFGAICPGGRHLLIGFAGGKPPALPLNHALVKNITITGFYWGGYRNLAPELLRESLTRLFDLYDQGKLQPTPGTVLPLESIAQGYDMLRSRKAVGKVVMAICDDAART